MKNRSYVHAWLGIAACVFTLASFARADGEALSKQYFDLAVPALDIDLRNPDQDAVIQRIADRLKANPENAGDLKKCDKHTAQGTTYRYCWSGSLVHPPELTGASYTKHVWMTSDAATGEIQSIGVSFLALPKGLESSPADATSEIEKIEQVTLYVNEAYPGQAKLENW